MMRFYTEIPEILEESDLTEVREYLRNGDVESGLRTGYWIWSMVVDLGIETTPEQRQFLDEIYYRAKNMHIKNSIDFAQKHLDRGEYGCARLCLNSAKNAADELLSSKYVICKITDYEKEVGKE